MFQRFHTMRDNRERGFTLIELLVVIIIIAILAAIAIPVFLQQREKGWRSQMQSALKNAATAMESFATENNGNYPAASATANPQVLQDEGFNPVSSVDVVIEEGGSQSFCLEATHDQLDETWSYSSESGEPVEVACGAPA